MTTDVLGAPARAWARRAASLPPASLPAVLVDVDGVITPGEGQRADLDVLAQLAVTNRRALDDPLVPALALCTGRQAPYVELMAQMIGTFLPCIFEHGAGLFFPAAFRYAFDESLGHDYAARLAALRAALHEPLLASGLAFVQPGKEATMTLYPLGDTTLEHVLVEAQRAVSLHAADWNVARNVHGIEVRPPGIDKARGARRLASALGLPLPSMAGVGDSDPDLSFLRLVGFSAAPANATPAVKQAVAYVARAPFGQGLIEILERIEQRNRAAA